MSQTIACLGAGNVGRAWAIVFARAGHAVRLFDTDTAALAERTLPQLRRQLDDLAAAGAIADAELVFGRIHVAPTLDAALQGATWVQESIIEDEAAKRALFAAVDARLPRAAVIASSTSAIAGSRLFETLAGRERCLVAHPVNPPSLIPLVELCATPWTTQDVLEQCRRFMTDCGQRPVVLRKEIEGFLLNRLQFALVGECLHLVAEGYCSVEDIDTVVTAGLARRWAFIGPFEVAHLNATAGYAGFMRGLGDMVRKVAADVRPDYPWDQALVDRIHAELVQRIPEEAIADRQAWRDRQLLAVARFVDGLRDPVPPTHQP